MSRVKTRPRQRPEPAVTAPRATAPRSLHDELSRKASADGATQKAMEGLLVDAGWRKWLNVRCNFPRFALVNQLLISQQHPSALELAGPRTWAKRGFALKDGVEPIRVWAYVPDKKKTQTFGWGKNGYTHDQGSSGEFKLVPVFAHDQVAPDPESQPHSTDPAVESTEANRLMVLLGQMIKFSSEIGSQVTFEPLTGAPRSYHAPGTGEIVVDGSPDFPPAGRAERLCVELANLLLDADSNRRALKFSEGQKELVVSSSVLCLYRLAGFKVDLKTIALPEDFAGGSAITAIRYAALTDRIATRMETAFSSRGRAS